MKLRPEDEKEIYEPYESAILLKSIRDGLNMRTDLLTLVQQNEELCDSIRTNGGVLQPVGVFPVGDDFQLIYGQRRVYCCRKLELETIRATIYPPPMDEAEILIIGTQENAHRVDVESVQFAEALKVIKRVRGWKNDDVAKSVSLNPVKVSRLLQLAETTDVIKDLVRNDNVGVTTALELAKFAEADQVTLIPQVRSKAISRDQLAELRKAKKKPAIKSPTRLARATAQLETDGTVTVARDMLTLDSFISSLEEVLVKARRAKQANVHLDTFISMTKDQSRTVTGD